MKVTAFEAGITTIVLRFYLMMVVVITGGLTGTLPLMLLGMVFFALAILGVKFSFSDESDTKVVNMGNAGNRSNQLNEAS